MTIETEPRPPVDGSPRSYPAEQEAKALIEEARRVQQKRRRRRWAVVVVVAVVVAAVAASIGGLFGGPVSTTRPATHPFPPPQGNPRIPLAAATQPERPGSLAIGTNGNLYIADDIRNQILERETNGTFHVVVGNGISGFSGDGGPATSAQLNDPGGITFGPDGTLYIADSGNGRIRAVSPPGTISTIAGNGTQTGWVTDGTPALAASLSPMAMTFGPDGEMYVAAQSEVLRLGPDGTFTRVLGVENGPYPSNLGAGEPAVDAPADGANGLAFDSAGDLFVAGSNNKSILMVNPAGILRLIGSAYPRGTGGLVTAPDGSVLAMGELSVLRLSPQGMQPVVAFPTTSRTTYLGITGFSPDGIAIGSDGTIYLDTFYGNGFADTSALAAISPQGGPSLLWRQDPAPAQG
jgi:sugar lactone lactonase YvrE